MELVRSPRLWVKYLKSNGYIVERVIGQGSFGDVYAVRCTKTGTHWAVKRLVARRDISEDSYAQAEIAALATIRHPTVVHLHEVILSRRLACLVMELAPAGNLEVLVLHGGWHAVNENVYRITNNDDDFEKEGTSRVCMRKENSIVGSREHRKIENDNSTVMNEAHKEYEKFTESETVFKVCDDSKVGLEEDYNCLDDKEMYDDLTDDVDPSSLSTTNNKPLLDRVFVKSAFTQVASALTFMHDIDLAHRDVNPSNILVFNRQLVKLADFGLCFRCREVKEDGSQGDIIKCTDYLGHERYQAPEVKKQEPHYAQPADVWSLGRLLYFMLKGDHPPESTPDDASATWKITEKDTDSLDNDVEICVDLKDISRDNDNVVPECYGNVLKEKCIRTLEDCCSVEITARPRADKILSLWVT